MMDAVRELTPGAAQGTSLARELAWKLLAQMAAWATAVCHDQELSLGALPAIAKPAFIARASIYVQDAQRLAKLIDKYKSALGCEDAKAPAACANASAAKALVGNIIDSINKKLPKARPSPTFELYEISYDEKDGRMVGLRKIPLKEWSYP